MYPGWTTSPNRASIITIEDFNAQGTPSPAPRSVRSPSESTVIVSAKTVILTILAMFILYCAAIGAGIYLLFNASTQIKHATEYAEPSYISILDILKSVKNLSDSIQIDFDMQALQIASLKQRT